MKLQGIRKHLVILLCIAAAAALIASGSFYRVGQGEEALVVTLGRVTATKGPGLYWKIPLIQSVISESVTTIHTSEYGFRTTKSGSAGTAAKYADVEDESVMLTNDDSIVSIEAIYQYTIRTLNNTLLILMIRKERFSWHLRQSFAATFRIAHLMMHS